jgi:hypothetical protein
LVVEETFHQNLDLQRNGAGPNSKSKVSVALPLLSSHLIHEFLRGKGPPPPPQDVHAYLPLRSYGFRFILQGDFVVPSSREAVDAASPWNLWLRDKVPGVFVAAVLRLVKMAVDADRKRAARGGLRRKQRRSRRRHEEEEEQQLQEQEEEEEVEEELEDGEEEDGCYYLELAFSMVPLPGQISDFFAPVCAAILGELRQHKILPTLGDGQESHDSHAIDEENTTRKGALLQFVLPIFGIKRPVSPRPDIDQYTEALVRRLGYRFVHPTVAMPPGVEDALGCETMGAKIWCSVLGEAESVWGGRVGGRGDGENADVKFQARWLVYVLAQLWRSRQHSMILSQVRSLHVFPTVTGKLVSLEDGPVLLPHEDAASGWAMPLSNDNSFLGHASFLRRTLSADFRDELWRDADASKMGALLGVSRVDSASFQQDIILPALCDAGTDPADLVCMLAFFKCSTAHLSLSARGGLLESVRGRLVVVDQLGRGVRCSSEIHVGREYLDEAPDPAEFLPAHELVSPTSAAAAWPTVSADYLKLSKDRAGWQQLFRQLGLSPFLYVCPSHPHHSPELDRLLIMNHSLQSRGEEGKEEAGGSRAGGGLCKSELERFERLVVLLSRFWHMYSPFTTADRGGKEEHEGQEQEQEQEEGAGAAEPRKIDNAKILGGDSRQNGSGTCAAGSGGQMSFLTRLRTSSWMPGSDGLLHRPCDLMPEEAWHVVGSKGVYSRVQRSDLNPDFVQQIGLEPSLSSQRVLKVCSSETYSLLVSYSLPLSLTLSLAHSLSLRRAPPLGRCGITKRTHTYTHMLLLLCASVQALITYTCVPLRSSYRSLQQIPSLACRLHA